MNTDTPCVISATPNILLLFVIMVIACLTVHIILRCTMIEHGQIIKEQLLIVAMVSCA